MTKDKKAPEKEDKETKEPEVVQKLLITVYDDNRIVYNTEPEMTVGSVWELVKIFKGALEN